MRSRVKKNIGMNVRVSNKSLYFAGCPSLVIPFGDVTMEGTGYGATATITCHHGYMIVGPSSAVCLGDRWSNVPSCHIAGRKRS